MKIIIVVLSIFIFLKTLFYGIYEIKENNKTPGICIIVLSFALLIGCNIVGYVNC